MKRTSSSNVRQTTSKEHNHPAPFFSIFYRGFNKINRSNNKNKLDQSSNNNNRTTNAKNASYGGDTARRTDADSNNANKKKDVDEVASPKFDRKPPVPANLQNISAKNYLNSSNKYNTPAAHKQPEPIVHNSPPSYENGYNQRSDLNGNKNGFHALTSLPSSPMTGLKKQGIFGNLYEKHKPNNLTKPPATTSPSQSSPQALSFGQRVKLHKGIRTGQIPVEALRYTKQQHSLLFTNGHENNSKKAAKKLVGNKACSMDTGMNELNSDWLPEALLAIGDAQPIVAKSTPKHAMWTPEQQRRALERTTKHCLFEKDVYEKMLCDSLEICDLLQTHLTECIDGVRARLPTALSTPFTTPPGSPSFGRSFSTQPIYSGCAFSPSIVRAPRVRIAVSNIPSQSPNSSTSVGPLSYHQYHFPVREKRTYFAASSMPHFPT